MKKKNFLIVSLLVGLTALVTGKVLAEVYTPKVISSACETRSGFLSVKNKNGECARNSREVILGESSESNNNYVVFLGSLLITRDGKFWDYNNDLKLWIENEYYLPIPENVDFSKIVQWSEYNGLSFLLDDGIVWKYDEDLSPPEWVNLGTPLLVDED